jgi:pyruvate formate-lyase activating enzyme-like uncharacterized protein
VYANEVPIDVPSQIIEVAETMSALGTGVTGGEPLLCLEKVTEYCRMLKDHFGREHQIHLYTAKAPSDSELAEMQGLIDEIRLHPPRECWDRILDSDFIRSAKRAKEMGFDIGFEVPSLPGLELLVLALPHLDFLNINELEWGETNAYAMRERGYELADELHNAICGARDWAEELCRHEKVHWCTSAFKDSVQLRERLKRIAQNTARPFDELLPGSAENAWSRTASKQGTPASRWPGGSLRSMQEICQGKSTSSSAIRTREWSWR